MTVASDEFLLTVAAWMRAHRHPEVDRVHAVVPDEEQTGGCHTCWDIEKFLWITYTDFNGRMQTAQIYVEYADFIKDLDMQARIEELRGPRAELMREMEETIAEMPGRSDMVFRILKDGGVRFKGPDGTEHRAPGGSIVTYLPPDSLEWLIKDGYVKPLCQSGMSTNDCDCRWHRLAALTEADREWLEFYGWENPFND